MRKSKLVNLLIVLSLTVVLLLTIVFLDKGKENKNSLDKNKILVTTSFYPLKYALENIGGDKIEIDNITPSGSEPHDYEPTISQINNIYKSKLLIYLGAGMDPWADKIGAELNEKNVSSLKISEGFELDKVVDDNFENNNTIVDPHIWLDPINMLIIGQKIRDRLIILDSVNANLYNHNFIEFTKKINDLDSKYKSELNKCKLNTIVTTHSAFQYLSRRYNFKSISISGVSPDKEPSTQKLVEVTKAVREKKVKYIFTETLVSPKLSQTIATETGAKTLVLNPIEGLTKEEKNAGYSWESIMLENLRNLNIALECQ